MKYTTATLDYPTIVSYPCWSSSSSVSNRFYAIEMTEEILQVLLRWIKEDTGKANPNIFVQRSSIRDLILLSSGIGKRCCLLSQPQAAMLRPSKDFPRHPPSNRLSPLPWKASDHPDSVYTVKNITSDRIQRHNIVIMSTPPSLVFYVIGLVE